MEASTSIDNIVILVNKKSNLEIFSETLYSLAEADKEIYVVTSDSRGSGKLVSFGHLLPDQIIEVGIAEQNLVGVASGLASMGKKVFAVSPACFLTARSLEQIKNDVCYSDNPVKLIGISAGVSYGALGTTHHSLHDFATLRAVNNISIVAPADHFETKQAILQSASLSSPIYIRFGKKNMPENIIDKNTINESMDGTDFKIGKGRLIRKGSDMTVIATGECVWPAFEAAENLSSKYKIECNVVSMHTIKPLDNELLAQIALSNKPIITVEEHSIHGGLGEAVASFLFQNGFQNKFKIVGLPDEHTVTGSQSEILNHYGISEEGLQLLALSMLAK